MTLSLIWLCEERTSHRNSNKAPAIIRSKQIAAHFSGHSVSSSFLVLFLIRVVIFNAEYALPCSSQRPEHTETVASTILQVLGERHQLARQQGTSVGARFRRRHRDHQHQLGAGSRLGRRVSGGAQRRRRIAHAVARAVEEGAAERQPGPVGDDRDQEAGQSVVPTTAGELWPGRTLVRQRRTHFAHGRARRQQFGCGKGKRVT